MFVVNASVPVLRKSSFQGHEWRVYALYQVYICNIDVALCDYVYVWLKYQRPIIVIDLSSRDNVGKAHSTIYTGLETVGNEQKAGKKFG